MDIVIGIILLVAAVFLTVAVLMQNGKAHNLSGTIAGGAETFFGKTKGQTIDKMLSKVTTVVSIAFVILVVVMYVIQPNTGSTGGSNVVLDDSTLIETTADTAAETSAEDTSAETAAEEETAA